MSRFIIQAVPLAALLLCLPTSVLAHPHGASTEEDKTVVIEQHDTASPADIKSSIERIFDRHADDIDRAGKKMQIRIKRSGEAASEHAEDDLAALTEGLADGLGELADSGLMDEMMELLADFADDLDVDSAEGVTVLRFDDKTVGRIETDADDNRISLSGLGKNLTLDRKTVIEDGKARTRITIDMDGGEDLEIDLPESLD